ncbi:flagellar protein FlaG [Granulosicoccaceae sp. 1_MG-2023]|nr:flagellar protein FlaG [Granulosicoccaceae sp. 1_MG-2023]
MSNLDSVVSVAPATHVVSAEYKQTEQQGQLSYNPVTAVKKSDNDAVQEEPNREELAAYVKALNEMGEAQPPSMQFEIDETTGKTVVRMTHSDTGELVRQIPSEEFLQIARTLKENNESLSSRPGQWIELDV